jgi:recombinational DNA repair protein (RecF pathway)
VAALWVEVLDHAHHCGADEAHDVLAWVRGSLAALAAAADPISLGLLGAWQLLGLIGHQPVLDRCVDTGREATEPLRFSFAEGGLVSRAPPGAEPGTVTRVSRGLVNALARAVGKSPEQIARQRLTGEQVEKTLDLVGKFCEYQLEIRLRSLRFLHSLRGH